MNWPRKVDQSDISSEWPLIRYIMDDFLKNYYSTSVLDSKMESLRNLVTASVLKEEKNYSIFFPDFNWFYSQYTDMKKDINGYRGTLESEALKNK
jgi:hypothetical protein